MPSPVDNEAMTEEGIETVDDRQGKIDRELRLGWQSRVLLIAVLVLSAFGLLARLLPGLTRADEEGLVICAAFGLLVWSLRAATPLASLTGFLLTSCLYLSTVAQPHGGWFHTALLPGLALFVLAFAATRFRRSQKEKVGLAESRRGRVASQVAANMGAAALVALALPPNVSRGGPGAGIHMGHIAILSSAILAALVAALAEAAADTVSSEIGQALGGIPVLITNARRASPGTDGAVTLPGTVAGCLAAAIVVLTAIPTLKLDLPEAAVAWTAAIAGLFADSLIGATLERRGWLNNDAVNFLSTAIAALLGLAMIARVPI